MLHVEFWPSNHWVTDDEAAIVRDIASAAVEEGRERLPALADDLYVLVHQTSAVIASTGDGGFAIGPHVIRWDVDPARGITQVATTSMRSTLLHELHHAARLALRPQERALTSWQGAAVFEGLATAFQSERCGRPLWGSYDEEVIGSWAEELFAQPVDVHPEHWRFAHPDGREAIVYRVGTWISDRATRLSGRSAADLVGEPTDRVLELAGLA